MLLSAPKDIFDSLDPLCEDTSFVLSLDNSAYIKSEKMSVKYRAAQEDVVKYIMSIYIQPNTN